MRLTRLKLRRLERGMLQVELAQRADIPRCRLSELENAHVVPRPDELKRLARVLSVSTAEIAERHNQGEPRAR